MQVPRRLDLLDTKSNLTPIKDEPKILSDQQQAAPRKWKHRHIDRHLSAVVDRSDYGGIVGSGSIDTSSDMFRNAWLVAEQPVLLSDLKMPVVKKGSPPPVSSAAMMMLMNNDMSKRYRSSDVSADSLLAFSTGAEQSRRASQMRKRPYHDIGGLSMYGAQPIGSCFGVSPSVTNRGLTKHTANGGGYPELDMR